MYATFLPVYFSNNFWIFPLYVLAYAIEFFFLPIEVFFCTSFSSFLSWQLPL